VDVYRRPLLITSIVVLALVAGAAAVAVPWLRNRDTAAMRDAARSFATAWQQDRLAGLPLHGTSGTEAATRTRRITQGLTPTRNDVPTEVRVSGVHRTEDDRDRATADVRIGWTLSGARRWTYDSSLPLVRRDGRWLARWTPQVIHPRLADGQVLETTRAPAKRGDILGAGDQVLVTDRPVVRVGIQPGRATDALATARRVAAVVDVDAAALAKRVRTADPNAFVDVITLRRSHYDRVRDRLRPIPGTVFQETELALAPTAGFARAVLGGVGPATKEIVDAAGGRVAGTDLTGLSGIQRAYDARLAGTPGLTVRALTPQTGDGTATTTAAPEQVLFTVPPVAGQPVRVTLDADLQRAAEAALEGAEKPAGLVAIRAGTGEVLAVANGGPGASGYNRALVGRYPPGSTFKVVSTYALLRDGLGAGTTVHCPAKTTVNGKVFTNAEGEVLGRVPFRTDFAHSCNTAFVGSADRITQDQLRAATHDLGFDQATAALGVDAFAGEIPGTADAVEHAADVIGQGRVLASPLAVATVSASVAAGRFAPPRLVLDPAAGTGAQVSSPGATGTPPQASGEDPPKGGGDLDPDTVRTLRSLMRAVVTEGTGTSLRRVPGGAVHGKTGTAEYGGEDPPRTHAWFTGFQDDLAFAVVVEDGGFGAESAAPLAADFLRRAR
jgi:cell division protein FtsI/penicillin-binding protein 2/type II secretory pathway pseudopilin PulG